MTKLSEKDPAIRNSPIYWFTLLETSRERGNFDDASRAMKELARLGIHITFRPPRFRNNSKQRGKKSTERSNDIPLQSSTSRSKGRLSNESKDEVEDSCRE